MFTIIHPPSESLTISRAEAQRAIAHYHAVQAVIERLRFSLAAPPRTAEEEQDRAIAIVDAVLALAGQR